MLLKFISPFRIEEKDDGHDDHKPCRSTSRNKTNHGSHERRPVLKKSTAVGLRIVVQSEVSSQGDQYYSNILAKSALRSTNPKSAIIMNNSAIEYSCFLKTCNLCDKGLSLDKEVYMYRGDQGFCSVECRDRQIFLDEMKELEASTKQMVASYRSSNCNPARHETRFILEELRRRHHHKPIPNSRRVLGNGLLKPILSE